MPPVLRLLLATAVVALVAAPIARADSFSLGVAAGEVTPNSAILWGHADQAGPVTLDIATDQAFARVGRRVKLDAGAASDLTVQSRVEGLQSSTRYWYRFRSGSALSDVGTFLTAPKRGDSANV